jgi:HK97 family phage major capsid protein
MVRASRNASNARRAPGVPGIESMPPGWESTPAGRVAVAKHRQDGEMASVGTFRAVIRDMITSGEIRPGVRGQVPPPGAVLDGQPFAANWAAFLKAIRTDDAARAVISNAWTERVPSEGGFLVPWTLTERVFAYLTEAVIWPRASVLTMGEYKVGLPTLDNPSQASGAQGLGGIQFDLTPDGGTITTSNPKFGAQFLEAQKLAALVSPVPNELAEDAAGAFDDLFSRIVGMGLAWELDDLFFNGNGAAEPQGILNASAALPVSRTSSNNAPVHADVIGLLKKLHPASKKRATWLASEDVFDSLVDEYLAVGTPTTQAVAPPMALVFDAARGCWTLFGVDIEITDHQPPAGTAGDLALADLSLYQIGSREMMTVDVSSKGATFPTDSSAYRIRTRVDGRYLPQSTYTLANGKVVSPLVVLQ